MGSYVIPDRLTNQCYDFLEIVLPELLEDVPLALRHRLWFEYDRAVKYYGEMYSSC
jgi:hypothetical protein